MKTIKCTVRKSGNISTFSVDCANTRQARAFVLAMMPDYYLIGTREISWKEPVHFDFVQVSHSVSINQHNQARLDRGVTDLPTYEYMS